MPLFLFNPAGRLRRRAGRGAAHTHAHANQNAHSHSYGNRHQYPHSNPYANPHPHANAHQHTFPHRYAHANGYAHSCPNQYACAQYSAARPADSRGHRHARRSNRFSHCLVAIVAAGAQQRLRQRDAHHFYYGAGCQRQAA